MGTRGMGGVTQTRLPSGLRTQWAGSPHCSSHRSSRELPGSQRSQSWSQSDVYLRCSGGCSCLCSCRASWGGRGSCDSVADGVGACAGAAGAGGGALPSGCGAGAGASGGAMGGRICAAAHLMDKKTPEMDVIASSFASWARAAMKGLAAQRRRGRQACAARACGAGGMGSPKKRSEFKGLEAAFALFPLGRHAMKQGAKSGFAEAAFRSLRMPFSLPARRRRCGVWRRPQG